MDSSATAARAFSPRRRSATAPSSNRRGRAPFPPPPPPPPRPPPPERPAPPGARQGVGAARRPVLRVRIVGEVRDPSFVDPDEGLVGREEPERRDRDGDEAEGERAAHPGLFG